MHKKIIRIGIDVRSIGKKQTGDETYILNLVEQLTLIDLYNQYYLFTDSNNEKELCERISLPNNFKIIQILPKNKYLWTMFLLPFQAFRLKLDILHVLYITPIFMPGKTQLITTIHDLSWKQLPWSIKNKDLFFFRTLIPISLKVADKIITISDNSKNDIMKFYPKIKKNKIKRIYIGGGYGADHGDYRFIKQEWPDIEQGNYILYLGTMQPRKNVPALINAYTALHHKYGSKFKSFPKLVIAGGRGYNFDEKIDEAGNRSAVKNLIIYPGYVQEKYKSSLISNARTFIYPSLYEGFGIPPLEAMHLGVPTIVSNRSCLPEIVGDAALIVDPDDCDGFCDQIYEVLTNNSLRDKLVVMGKERAALFSWEELSQKTLELYYEVMNINKC